MTHEIKEGVLIINLSGSLLTDELRKPVAEVLEKNLSEGTKKVLIGMRDVKFINSTGLAVLLGASSIIRGGGGKLALCSAPDQTKQLIKMIKLEPMFPFQADEAAGIAFLNA